LIKPRYFYIFSYDSYIQFLRHRHFNDITTVPSRDVIWTVDSNSLVPYSLDKYIFVSYLYLYLSDIRYVGTRMFFSYSWVSMGTRGYLQNYLKNKYLIINSNKIKYITIINFK